MDGVVAADLTADLDEFVGDVFRCVIYEGQRRWARVYLRGLMLPGLKRKSVQPMAAALGVPEQHLGHFVGVAAWHWQEVTARPAGRAVRVLTPTAWILDDHPFLRTGRHIACAKKQYAGNGPPRLCQIAVSWHAVSPQGSTPLDWRLFIPEAWADDMQRRAAARIPADREHRTKPAPALDMPDDLSAPGLGPPLAPADSLHGQNVSFRQGLEDRHVPWLLAIPGPTTSIPATGTPVSAWARQDEQINAYAVARDIRYRAHRLRYREPEHGHAARYGWFATARVHVAGTTTRKAAGKGRDGGYLREYSLLVQRRRKHPAAPEDQQACRIWLTDLPATTPLPVPARHATSRWEVETDYKDMNQNLGPGQYQGRTRAGFHHHVTLVSAAHLFCLEQRLNPKAPAIA